jgi:hypothetical protein
MPVGMSLMSGVALAGQQVLGGEAALVVGGGGEAGVADDVADGVDGAAWTVVRVR